MRLKGTLFNTAGNWRIMVCTHWEDEVYSVCHDVVPVQQSLLNLVTEPGDEIHNVECEIVDEFSHPEEFMQDALYEGKSFARIF
jgi:hypothetical protein